MNTADLGIDIRKWVGRWLDIIVEVDGRMEVWIIQHIGGERMMIQDALGQFQAGKLGLIPEGVNLVEDMSLRRYFRMD